MQRAGKADFLRLMLFLSRTLKQWRKLQLREQEKTFLPEVMPTLDVEECRQGRSWLIVLMLEFQEIENCIVFLKFLIINKKF